MTNEDMVERYEQSLNWRERLQAVTPGGAQTMSKRAAAFGTEAFPTILTRGEAGRVWDLDGNEYVDLILGLAAIGIGYNDPSVNGAVHRQVERGASFSLPTLLECTVAERLTGIIPCADMVRFVKTGSEACQAAVRIARRMTGRTHVLVCGYHGWHDWYAASKTTHPGVPEDLSRLVSAFRYNDLGDFHATLTAAEQDHPTGVAAVILEPTLVECPEPGFLETIRRVCTARGIVLIFDEMVTGFRWETGGYQARCGVTPDLATFGKAMANGYPLACVVGTRALMEGGDLISGTFGGEAIALAACDAVLDVYDEEPIIASIDEAGRIMLRDFRSALKQAGLPATILGQPQHPKLVFATGDAHLDQCALAYFVQEMAAEGVLLHPSGWNVCADHCNEDDLTKVRDAAATVAERVKQALAQGTLPLLLRGQAPQQGVRP